MRITPSLLVAAVGCTAERAALFAPLLDEACAAYGITDTPARLAAFLAQIGHESGSFRYTEEVWGPTAAQLSYEGRTGLGNINPGDGERYKGHGLIQTTGRFNHRAARDRLRDAGQDAPDFEANPDLLGLPKWAAWSAADYWDWKGCNALADAGNFEAITVKINGGTNGAADRRVRWEKAKAVLAGQPAAAKQATAPPMASAPRPDQEPYTQETPVVAPVIVGAAIDAMFTVVPKLLDLFKGSSENAKKNVEAAKMLLAVGKEATQSVNEQELIEKLQSSPEAGAALQKAVEDNYFKISEVGEKSVAVARDFATSYSQLKDVRTVAWQFTFIELFSLLMVIFGFGGVGALIYWNRLAQSTVDNIAMLAVVGTIIAVREFWLGSSAGSRQKDPSPEKAI